MIPNEFLHFLAGLLREFSNPKLKYLLHANLMQLFLCEETKLKFGKQFFLWFAVEP